MRKEHQNFILFRFPCLPRLQHNILTSEGKVSTGMPGNEQETEGLKAKTKANTGAVTTFQGTSIKVKKICFSHLSRRNSTSWVCHMVFLYGIPENSLKFSSKLCTHFFKYFIYSKLFGELPWWSSG